MENIIDYVREYGDVPFRLRPFGDEDGLVLSQFSYFRLDGLVPGVDSEKCVRLSQFDTPLIKKKLFEKEWLGEENEKLFQNMVSGRRFREMTIKYYVNIIDKEEGSQFCAVTCFLPDIPVCVVFRGTDETLAGWKEDFYMALREPVKSQKMSGEYLEMIGLRCAGRLIVTGHSKGGNLAVYAASGCGGQMRDRIFRVYNYDGPGFGRGVLDRDGYEAIKSRVHKIVPDSSIIGMLMEKEKRYRVVESKGFGVLQHNPYNWHVRDGQFVFAGDMGKGWKLSDKILNQWIASLDEKQMAIFIENLFGILEAGTEDNFYDMASGWREALEKMYASVKEMDEETKKELTGIVKALFQTTKEMVVQSLKFSKI